LGIICGRAIGIFAASPALRWTPCLACATGNRSKRLESALALIQRAGRLRTHLLLAAGKIE
jgi:hypothetical protein